MRVKDFLECCSKCSTQGVSPSPSDSGNVVVLLTSVIRETPYPVQYCDIM